MADLIMAELAQAKRLKQRDLDAFVRDGIPALNLAKTWCGDYAFVMRDAVVFDGDRFEFARLARHGTAREAYVFPLWDAYGEVADCAGWAPPNIGLWLGRVTMLGEEQSNGPRLDEPLQVHTTVAAWFRAARRGVFLIDAVGAADLLRTETLGAESATHARRLRRDLTVPPPVIRVIGQSTTIGIAA